MRHLVRLMDGQQPGAALRVLPTIVLGADALPRDPEVEQAIERVSQRITVYEQYRFLPHVPYALGRDDVELCWQDDDNWLYFPRHAYRPALMPAPDDACRLDPDACDPDRYRMFARFTFPVIGIPKPTMSELADARGFLPIMQETWTCRWPTMFGNPCGFCVPCTDTRREGLGHRVPRPTRVRQAVHRSKWRLVRTGDEWSVRLRAAGRSLRGGSS